MCNERYQTYYNQKSDQVHLGSSSMQNLRTHMLTFFVGVVVGIGVVVAALVLLRDDGTSSGSLPISGTTETAILSDTTNPDARVEGIVSVPSDISELVFPMHAFDRKRAIASWVATLSDDQILNWLQQSTEPTWSASAENRNELQSALLQKLSITSPEQAVAFATSREDQQRHIMTSIVLRSWARIDLESAIAYIKNLDGPEGIYPLPTILQARTDLTLERQREIAKELGNENYAFANYFRTLIEGEIENPEETWSEVINLASQENVQSEAIYALSKVAVAWVEKDGVKVLDEIVSSISQDSEFSFALSNVFGALATDEPEEIFDYIMNNLGDQAQEVIQRAGVLYNWARKDPRGMLSKAETLPASRFRQDLARQAVWQWADDNPRQVLNSLNDIPPENREEASRAAIRTLARISPTEAAKFVLDESEYSAQLQLARALVGEWSYQDVDATKDWVLNLPYNDPLRADLIPTLTRTLVDTDPKAAFQLALEQPIEEPKSDRTAALSPESSIISSIAYQDLELAIELLPQVRDTGRSKWFAYRTIGNSLIQNGEMQRAFDLAKDLTGEQQAQYYQSIGTMWAMQDSQGLLEAFDDFPTEEIKSKIALSVVMFNSTTNTYSLEEAARLEKYLSKEDQENLEVIQDIDLMNPSPEEVQKLQELFPW